jgi:hypothetical protein
MKSNDVESATNEQWYKRTVIFCFRFFHESSSREPLKITLGSFKIFAKTCGLWTYSQVKVHCHLCQLQIATGINDTNNKNLPLVSTPPVANNGEKYKTAYTLKLA